MFYRRFTLPDPFHQIELFGLVEPIATDFGKPQMVSSLYMVRPSIKGGRVLVRRVACATPLKPPCIRGC